MSVDGQDFARHGHGLPAPIRALSRLLVNFFTAVIGPVIAEAVFYNLYHPASFQGLYVKELTLGAVAALLLGGFVYYKWQSGAAQWIWIFGLCGLAWFLIGSHGQVPFIPEWLYTWGTLSFVSTRAIAYSAGAWLADKLLTR